MTTSNSSSSSSFNNNNDELNINSSSSSLSFNNDELNINKKKSGRPIDPVWNYYEKGKLVSKGHWQATCKFCNLVYKKGSILDMQEHLGFNCSKVTKKIG